MCGFALLARSVVHDLRELLQLLVGQRAQREAGLVALHHLVLAVGLAVTIIGIPFAWQHLKLAVMSLAPVGTMVLER